MTADILREKFLFFFKIRKHKIVESDSLVPKDDPTVLFTPAGMNQFKKEFMGFDSGFKRAATAQRCLRTDDLDKVGETSSHHTFFEMLGNFSFGDYFKEDAIAWAWEFLTKELKITSDKLCVSVYQDDDEAYNIWKDKIKVPVNKIVRLGDKENFWPAEAKTKGPNGPCGPCSEIFYDFGPGVGCGEKICDPSCPCGRFVEIWNLVFTQFNRKDDATLEPLPNKNIDTGMGLERLAAVMQGKQNNFETELFQPVIKEICDAVPRSPNLKVVYAIADHIRAAVFSIYDGIRPSNEGRGYVIRKIIRKAGLHLMSLGIKKPFLNRLVGIVAEIMRKPYPELTKQQEDIAQVILSEEKSFIKVLGSSDEMLEINEKSILDSIENDLVTQPKGADGSISASAKTYSTIAISTVRLYDTYGIPLDFSIRHFFALIERNGLKYNPMDIGDEIKDELNKLREFSKSRSKMKGDVFGSQGLGIDLSETEFVGYEENSCQAQILAILKDGKETAEASGGEGFQVVLDRTPFYAESGGQVGDTGKLINGKNVFEVSDTKKIDNVFLHIGKVASGMFKKDDKVTAQINSERRLNIARNHTATHILQAALREVLGKHVQQQGSLVGEEKLRFDFTHFKGLTKEEIARVEEIANNYVVKNKAVSCKEMAFKDAKKEGALAFFEEKYGEDVRVVAIGDISKELCGGTHLDNIGQIGIIKIISESSVASGIRRIEAVTAGFAQDFIKKEEQKAAEEAKKQDKLKQIKEQEKERGQELKRKLPEMVSDILEKVETVNGINFATRLEPGLDMGALRLLADKLKEKLKQGVIALGSQDEENKRAYLVVAVTQDLLTKGVDAGALIRQAAPLIGGSGGGRKDFAQAGGTLPENFTLAFTKIKDIINGLGIGQKQ